MDHQTIGDIITSNMHRRCLHEHRRCVTDVSPNVRRYIADGIWRRNIWKNFNACIEIFLDVPMPWRSMAITRRRSFAEPLVHGGAALAMPKCVHRESIGRLKKPRGTVALVCTPYRHYWQ